MLATSASDTRTKKFEPPQQIIPVHIERQTLVIRVEADPCHSFSKRVTRSRSQSKVSKDRNDRRSRRIETSEKGRVRRVPQQPQSQLHVHLDLPILSLVSSSIALCSLSPSSRSFPCSIAIQHHASSLHPKPHPHPPLFPLGVLRGVLIVEWFHAGDLAATPRTPCRNSRNPSEKARVTSSPSTVKDRAAKPP